jgi:integrase
MKRGNITKRGKESWQLKYEGPRGADGKRQPRYATVKGTYKDAQKELTRLLGDRDAGKLPTATRDTVKEFLATYLDGMVSVSPKTLERYRALAERQINPHLGDEKIRYLTREQIESWHATLLGKGLAPATVRHADVVLCKALKRIKNTAALEREKPRAKRQPIEILEPDDAKAALTSLEGHYLWPIAFLALRSGMRRGEICGLCWHDLNLEAATVRIEGSLEQTKAGLRLKEPKTERGKRTITIDPETVDMLRKHKVETLEQRMTCGMGGKLDDVPVFSFLGEWIPPDKVSRDWARNAKVKATFHSLRHTHASVLLNNGVDILTVSKRLGHSKPSITLDVYGHTIKGSDERAATVIAEALK